jgi:NAD(P)H-dependent FMN reductase
MTILAIPGSLREHSSSNLILKAIVAMSPAEVHIEVYSGLGALPHFNDAADAPESIRDLRMKIRNADAVLIVTPEYAFGVPGSLKNALDWTVASGEFIDKPVGLITASSQGEHGHAALLLILKAISAKIIPDATRLISFVRARLDSSGSIKDSSLSADLLEAITALRRAAQQS